MGDLSYQIKGFVTRKESFLLVQQSSGTFFILDVEGIKVGECQSESKLAIAEGFRKMGATINDVTMVRLQSVPSCQVELDFPMAGVGGLQTA